MAGYDPYAGHYAHLPGTTPPPQPLPVHSLPQQPYDDRTDPLLQPQDPFATPSYQLRDEPTWPTPAAATGDLADGPGHHHHQQQGGTFGGGVGAGTSLYPRGQYHPYDNHQQQNMSYDYLQNQQPLQQQGPGGGGTYDDDQAPLLLHGQQGGLGWSTSGPAPGQADPSLQLPGGFDPTQQGPYGPPPPSQPSPGFGGPAGPGFIGSGQQGPQQGYDDDAVVRYGRIPQRQPRRYKTVKRQSFPLRLDCFPM